MAMGKEGFVGMTGFEPATTRPPDVYATGLRYIPMAQTYRILVASKNLTYRYILSVNL